MKLVIAEKPSVGRAIANVVGASNEKNGFVEGNGYIVTWCIGHLITPANPDDYNDIYKTWTYEQLPIIPDEWKYNILDGTKGQYDIIRKLMHNNDVDSVVCATDAGREGELIFRLVYNMAGCKKPIERLWTSSLEDSAIREGMDNLRSGRDYDNLYKAAMARQKADWIVGFNYTRLFSVLYGVTLNVGRVFTPTLSMIVDREMEITNFKKKQYFLAHIEVCGIDAVSDRFDIQAEADNVADNCKGEKAKIVSVIKENKKAAPPKLYDLTTLQREANKLFGFKAKDTLEYTQNLYEKKLVTYPRTDSRYLTDDMENSAGQVIEAIRETIPFVPDSGFTPNIKPTMNSKKVSDHHAIIPTVEITKHDLDDIPESERKILFLIAARLLSATSSHYQYVSEKIIFECNEIQYTAKGTSVSDIGWKEFEEAMKKYVKASSEKEKDDDITEQNLPEVNEGDVLEVSDSKVTEHFTKPPKRYTEDTLLSAMERAGSADMDDDVERKGIGTPATRAEVIERLVGNAYVIRDKKSLVPTDKGLKLITILPDTIKSAKLTADWENTLSLIAKGEYSYDDFMSGISNMVTELIGTYNGVSKDNSNIFSNNKVIGDCPNCGADMLLGKYGAYCSKKCGMKIGRIMNKDLTEAQYKSLLQGKRILVKGIESKKSGKPYDAYFTPEQVVDNTYKDKDGNEVYGKQFKYKMEFPQKAKKKNSN